MSSDKEKRSKAETLLNQFKQETSKIEELDTATNNTITKHLALL